MCCGLRSTLSSVVRSHVLLRPCVLYILAAQLPSVIYGPAPVGLMYTSACLFK